MSDTLPLSREEQFQILEQDRVADAIRKFLGGDIGRVGELFSISQEEYFAWVLKRPLPQEGWIRYSPSQQDGVYFLKKSDSSWTIYQQERGGIDWIKYFSAYEDARRYLEIDYGIGRHLRRETEI